MRQARAGHDTRGQRVTPRCRWARARPGFETTRRAKLAARTAHGRVATHRHTQRPGTTGMEGAGGTGGHGRASRQRTETHTSMPVAADVEGVGGTGGPGCGARGRRRGLDVTTQHRRRHRCGGRRRDRRARAGFEIDHSEPQARVWRSRGRPGPTAHGTPAAPQATQAGRPPPTGTPSSPAQQHTTRRPERQRRHKKHSTGARAHRPAPLDATTQTRVLRSTCVPCRSARAARQWRRSSRSPHLRRRAGPRR